MKENFVEYMERSIREHWNLKSFSDYQAETYTYEDVANHIYRLHAFFTEAGLKQGSKVSVLGRNSSNWAVTYLAVATYGATIVPILPDFHPSDIENIVTHSDSRFLFASPSFLEKLDIANMKNLDAAFSLSDFTLKCERAGSESIAAFERSKETFVTDYLPRLNPEKFSLTHIDGEMVESIVYTSGTTGFSKGVMLNHTNIISNLVYAQANVPLNCGDTILSFLPLAHSFGNAFEFIFPFSRGCHITFLGKPPTTKVLIDAFAQIKPRMVLSVPLVIEKIYYKQIRPMLESGKLKTLSKIPIIQSIIWKKVRDKILNFFGGNVAVVIIGGASFNSEVEDFLTKIKFPFTVGYGMTECAPLIGYADWRKRTKASSGHLVDRMELKIIGNGNPENADNFGEFCVRGDNVTKGYYKNLEETTRTIDGEGWFHTGDLGYLDSEGFIHIRGRSKTMILDSSGQNIYPEEIEAKLNNLPLVAESLVLEDDGKLTALIFPDLAEANNQGLNAEDIANTMEKNRATLNRQLPEYSRVTKILLQTKEFIKTPTNKVKRFMYSAKEAVGDEK